MHLLPDREFMFPADITNECEDEFSTAFTPAVSKVSAVPDDAQFDISQAVYDDPTNSSKDLSAIKNIKVLQMLFTYISHTEEALDQPYATVSSRGPQIYVCYYIRWAAQHYTYIMVWK